MSTFVFVTWNGGGNLTPALGIARALAERGHTVAFLGEETQRRRIEAAGLAQYISLRTKGEKQDKKAPDLAYYQKGKRKTQGAFDVQITRNGCR